MPPQTFSNSKGPDRVMHLSWPKLDHRCLLEEIVFESLEKWGPIIMDYIVDIRSMFIENLRCNVPRCGS